jgi:hypothetical protein
MSEQDPKIGPTHRHGDAKPFEMAFGDSENMEAISQHITRWIGAPATVFHELLSDKVHIDVHIVAPSEKFPWYTLVTSGMSDRPMDAPAEHRDWAYSELYLCLPPDWKMGDEDWKSDRYYWPVKALKYLARFPHQYSTWLWYGHTIPNGDPPEPVSAHTKLCAFVLLKPHCVPAGFHELKINDGKTIRFFALVPMHGDELALKMRKGAEAFERTLVAAGRSELLDPDRPSVITPGKPGFFRRLFGSS